MAPIMVGMLPFGLLVGVASTEAGFGVIGAIAFSAGLFAGASQLAAIGLLTDGAPALVAIATIVVINARLMLYGASLAPWWSREPLRTRIFASYFLTDQAFGLSLARYESDMSRPHRLAFYLGGAVPIWALWNIVSVIGVYAGNSIPADVPLRFAVPLVFLGLFVPALQSRPKIAAGISSAVVAVTAAGLPNNLAMPLAAAVGISVGSVLAMRAQRDAEALT